MVLQVGTLSLVPYHTYDSPYRAFYLSLSVVVLEARDRISSNGNTYIASHYYRSLEGNGLNHVAESFSGVGTAEGTAGIA